MPLFAACWAAIVVGLFCMQSSAAADNADSPVLKVPEGFSIELVAGSPLVERPIVAAFDDEGRLYVAESSGSNDPVKKQLEERPHRIVRLDDGDGDGRFDRRTVFADRMMFPEGTMFLDGSLYVSAPPSIWKLTDLDGDGVADERIEWFQGKTLTGCANDLHGPYLGPDGWIYWCKGAFAEQTHIVNGREWKSRAAHIFRCRPDGTGLEPVLTGGMDNPVDVVFMPDGERILSATFLAIGPRCDGLAHAIYGGVYGKQNGALEGHARTGELMPTLVPMSAAAPSGLERYESDVFGDEFRDNLFLCQFNLRKVSRHVLRSSGSTYVSEDNDFVSSDNVDFHPTDVLMDADGSLLVFDTGGWYKLCCPTSQLWKPDVVGGIYRVRRVGARVPDDPRGLRIAWQDLSIEQLWAMLSDSRPAVRHRAGRAFVQRRSSEAMRTFIARSLKPIAAALVSETDRPPDVRVIAPCDPLTASLARVWAISQLESAESRKVIRQLLAHEDQHVRHAALHSVSLYRDGEAAPQAMRLLTRDTPANCRIAAEALGRIGEASAVPHLLAAAAASADDRILQHSITYALIELNQPAATRAGLASQSPRILAVSLIALDQMPGGQIDPHEVIRLLGSGDDDLRHAARWLVSQHVEWGGDLAQWLRGQMAALPEPSRSDSNAVAEPLESLLVTFARHPAVQQLLADTIESRASGAAQAIALRVMARANVHEAPATWRAALASSVADADATLLPLAIAAARKLPSVESPDDALNQALLAVAEASQNSQEHRVVALAGVSHSLSEISEPLFDLLLQALSTENPVTLRSAAADAIAQAQLKPHQLARLCEALKSAGPLELNRLLAPFRRVPDEQLGLQMLASLKEASALPSLRIDVVRETLAEHGPAVERGVAELESLVNVDAAVQRKRIEELLPAMAGGDVRRGHAVFHSSKAACSACHRLGYAGGTTGPELSRIGEIRTERDLLESILYPSLSFVRSYEPVLIITVDGRTVNGNVIDETSQEYVIATDADHQVRVRRSEVDEMHPSKVSTMPAGLDQQLTTEQLADLVAFLRNARQ